MKRFVVSLSLFALVSGCAAASTTDPQQEPEEIEAAEQAFGEAACATMSVADPVKGTVISGVTPTNMCWRVLAESPDSNYGTNACPTQYVVEIPRSQMPATLTDGNFTYSVTPIGYYATTREACTKLNKTIAEYGRIGSSWSLMRSRLVRGTWVATSPSSGYCADEIVNDYVAPGVLGPYAYDALRFAVSAYTNEMLKGTSFISPERVSFLGQNDCIQ